MPKTLLLATPVPFATETVSALDFRDPTGRDIRELSIPIDEDGLNPPVMALWIERLTGRPMPFVDSLAMSDWMEAARTVSAFFREAGRQSGAAAPPTS
jgi:hypothetical protein